MDNLLEINQLTVSFKIPERIVTAVDDVNFEIRPGETLGLMGESGCGKSITSLAIMRLLPPNSVYGMQSSIDLFGQDLLEVPEVLMRSIRGKRMSMIFQEPMTALNPVLNIGQQLGETLKLHQNLSKKAIKTRVIELLQEVEIPDPEIRIHHYPHQLSGGQKQRVLIAIALACNPEILIADEPTTALDVTVQAQILSLLKKLQQQHQMSLLLITHDLGVIKAMADRVCVMYAGQIVESAPVGEFFTKPLHPYAQQLLISLPTLEKRGQELPAIKGSVPTLESTPSGCRFHPRCAHCFTPCPTIEPVLQTKEENRLVRCHLYPEHDFPPPLLIENLPWSKTKDQQEVLLSVRDLQVFFTQRSGLKKSIFKAVNGLSFDLQKGKTLALVGESGCGKTTTARAIIRLQTTSGGKILFKERDIAQLRGQELQEFRKKVQIIFQDPFSSMNPRMTIGEILAEGMKAQHLDKKSIAKKQGVLLEQVNLPANSLHRYPHQFSGGQRQRICIARALATEPELLICDEPTSALDISVQAQILNLLKNLQAEYGLTYLFITHNMGVVSYIADEVLVMAQGKAVERGETEQLFKKPTHEYTKQLLSGVLKV
ncbi:ABC dipeptide/oligopeptide/nickel transport, ATPase component (plasmid) [Legionella adelaidensis]|uniref:ABC dipeptide/oligopeptide/nickel transport, ATPase component n=1 Tax=Legionella adelaidensis TaxID=45056 RepID=A0A0W0R3J6_9GAMM|nr:ABC transporter ATP-binding protein [Legionella adelaidensis]KTC65636.1 ABC dipeptide/oligopeptide/nickel transport, ATPase component [Legionella adelaidensis]VEH85167.1 ABC dipeptide/oligopeptide/nickel transport, ATPase component [Legionella adelaidensis]